MIFSKRVLVLLLSICITSQAIAQYSDDDGGIETESGYLRSVEFAAGATYQNLLDQAISPVLYTNIGPIFRLSNLKISKTNYSEVNIQASSMWLKKKTNELLESGVKTQRALLDYRFLFKMPVESRAFDIRAGGMLSAMFAHKKAPYLQDAATIYEYAVSLGISGKITKEITLFDKTSFLSWDVSIPIVANFSRPAYLNLIQKADPEVKPVGEFLDNATTGLVGKYLRLNSRAYVLVRLDNGNAVKLGYQWDYSRIKSKYNKVYFAEHSVFLAFMFNY
ncbi:MAG: hypothetical protein H6551_03810 [Chitinophagales bacterium]|nr:hypothetical protein [Chitinophagaceae bacterium]MCB9064249.1 hypothetical protein [Chitinophagales bacterium]